MSARFSTLGTVVRLAARGVRRRALTSGLTVLAVALGVALVIAVERVRRSTERSYREASRGYDVVLGPAHGSPLTAVLSTLFHVDEPSGTLPWSVYEDATKDPRVAAAVPYAMGDTFRGHRVIGTTAALFEVLADAEGRALGHGLRGRMFRPEAFEAVVGSTVARRTGMTLGASFQVSHGLLEGGHVHGERWVVTGVLRPTGTPHDRAIYIPVSTFYAIPGHGTAPVPAGETDDEPAGAHEEDHSGNGHDEGRDGGHGSEGTGSAAPAALSAVGIRLKSPGLRLPYLQEFRTRRTDAQAVLPGDQIRKLMAVVGDVNQGVRWIAWLVTAVAALGILVSLYDTIQGRRREIAILRALGARRRHVFAWILLEAVLLCLAGGLLGLLLGHGGLAALAPSLLDAYGVRLDVAPGPDDGWVLLAVLVLGVLAGLLPAARGLLTPVAEGLDPIA